MREAAEVGDAARGQRQQARRLEHGSAFSNVSVPA
jgi:hypothetical protein